MSGPASSPEAGATVRSEGLAARGRPHSVEAQARYAAGRVALAPLVVRSGLGQATLAGSVPVLADAGEWDLRGEVAALDLAPVLALAGLEGEGPASGTLRVEGPRDAPRARTDLDARVVLDEAGRATGEAIAVTLAASSEGDRVEVERLTAEVAGGRIEGSGRFDAATRALGAKATATGLAWARLPLLPESLRRLGGTLAADGRARGHDRGAHPARRTRRWATRPSTARRCPRSPSTRARTATARARGAGPADAAFLKGAGQLEGDWPVRLEIDVAGLPAQALLDAVTARRQPDATLEARERSSSTSRCATPGDSATPGRASPRAAACGASSGAPSPSGSRAPPRRRTSPACA